MSWRRASRSPLPPDPARAATASATRFFRLRRGLRAAPVLTAILLGMPASLALAQQAHLTLYKTVSSAACSDETVWIDPKTQTYYRKGERLYGKTTPGGYNCRKQAEAAGYHAGNAR